ncbi:MAG: sensor histidine kinase [Actinomycetota bacterium]|nr:sensor histidine kinase [Actinomycetota bacterium]
MLSGVDAKQREGSLAHQALLYGSKEEFLAGTVPFIRDGLDQGDPIRITATARNAGWLRTALGTDARHVTFVGSGQWYRHPVRALAAARRTVRAASSDGQRLRIIEEPLWTARTAQESKEWARYESLVNAALARANATLLCTYDIRFVDLDAVAQVTRTHPELVVNGGARPSPGYADPAVFNAECDRSPLPELPPPVLWLRFDQAGQLVTLRDFVTSHAIQAGATISDVGPFVLAVDEIASNAIQHGGGSGVLQIWTGPQRMLCEVSDTGAGLPDPLAGYLPPDRFATRGRGLWLARQLCDLVELRTGPAGTTVRLHLPLP